MEQYLFKITASFTDKNKLYAAFSKHVLDLDGTLIKGERTLDVFISALQGRLMKLNEEFSRCKPLNLTEVKKDWSINPEAKTVGLKVEGSWHASFYKVDRAVELEDGFLQYFIPDNNHPIKLMED